MRVHNRATLQPERLVDAPRAELVSEAVSEELHGVPQTPREHASAREIGSPPLTQSVHARVLLVEERAQAEISALHAALSQSEQETEVHRAAAAAVLGEVKNTAALVSGWKARLAASDQRVLQMEALVEDQKRALKLVLHQKELDLEEQRRELDTELVDAIEESRRASKVRAHTST